MNAFLLSLATLLVVALLALFAAPLFVDWNAYKPAMEAQASALLGRKVVIEGPVKVRVLPAPMLFFERVKVADAEGGLDKPFVEAASLRALLSLTPLMSGHVEARRVDIEKPTLRLAIAEDGSGNWNGLGVARGGGFAYFPSTVTLEEVSVVDATVEIEKAGYAEPFRLEKLNGDLGVRALSGPYSFNGVFVKDGATRELRFSTGPVMPDGKFRLKSMLRDVSAGITYQLDGEVTGLSAEPSLLGAFTVRQDPEPVEPGDAPKGPRPGPPLELKAVAAIDSAQAELSNMEIVLRRGTQAFNLKGGATVDLGGSSVVNGELHARLIDLDALVQSEGTATPYRTLTALARALTAAGSGLTVGSVDVAFEQATIGADLVKDVSLQLAPGEAGEVDVRNLHAVLPGETTVEASGRIAPADGAPAFAGKLRLEGRNLRSLTRWASGGGALVAQSDAGAFTLETAVDARADAVVLSDVNGKMRDASFQGALRYSGGDKRALDLSLTSDRLDVTDLVDAPISLRPLAESVIADDPDQPAAGLGFIISDTELRLKVGIGALVAPGLPQGKLDLEMSYAGDTIDVKRMDFVSGDALSVTAAGRVERSSAKPRGRLDLSLKAAGAEGARAIAGLVALPAMVATEPRLERVVPLDLTVKLEADPDAKTDTAVLTAEGTIAGSTFSLRSALEGNPTEPAKGMLEAEATLGARDPQTALGLLFPAVPIEGLIAAGPGRATITATVSGRPSDGLKARLAFDAQQTRVKYDGRIWDGKALALDGTLAATLNDAALALRIAGLPAAQSAGSALEVKARLTGTSPTFAVSDLAGTVATNTFQGSGKIDLAGDRPAIAATIGAKAASFAGLFGSTLAPVSENADDQPGRIGSAQRVWPDQIFALDDLTAFDLDLDLTAGSVRFAPDLVLSEARLEAQLVDGIIRVEPLKGRLFGGALEVKGSVTPRGGGAALQGTVALQDASLDLLTRRIAGKPAADGVFGLAASFEGEGLSPAGIAASLVGKGTLDLRDGTLANLSAEPLKQVEDDMGIASRAALGTERVAELTQQLPSRVTSGSFAFGKVKLPFEVRNGVIRIDKAVLRGETAEASVDMHLELATLRLDSEWTLSLRSGTAQVPPVTLVVAGPLAEGHTITAAVETDTLQRYLTMRSMEQDVERLENLDVSGKTPPEQGAVADPELEPEPPIQVPSIKPAKPKPAPQRRRAPPASAQQETLPWSPFTAPNAPPATRAQPPGRRDRAPSRDDTFFDQYRGG